MSGKKRNTQPIRFDPDEKAILDRTAGKFGMKAPEIARRATVMFAILAEEKGVGWLVEQTSPEARDKLARSFGIPITPDEEPEKPAPRKGKKR